MTDLAERRKRVVLRAQLPRKDDMAGSRLNPVFRIEGVEVVLHPLDTVSVAVDPLGQQVASLADEGQRIAGAVDEPLARSWGGAAPPSAARSGACAARAGCGHGLGFQQNAQPKPKKTTNARFTASMVSLVVRYMKHV